MRRVQTGRTIGDETAPYDIYDYKAKRADEFVQEVLETEPHEWGYIEVYANGRVEYRDGKLLTDIPVAWKHLNIEKIKASGGWSRMDYRIEASIDFGYGFQEAMEFLERKEENLHEELLRYKKIREMELRKESLPESEFTKTKRAKQTSEVTSEVTSEISDLDRAALEYHRKVMEYEYKTGLQLANMTSFKDGIVWLARKIIEVIDAQGDSNIETLGIVEEICKIKIKQNNKTKEG